MVGKQTMMECEKCPAVALAHTKNLRGSSLFLDLECRAKGIPDGNFQTSLDGTEPGGHAERKGRKVSETGKAWLSLSGRLPAGHYLVFCFFKHLIFRITFTQFSFLYLSIF